MKGLQRILPAAGRFLALHGALLRQSVRGAESDPSSRRRLTAWRRIARESNRLPLALYSQVAWDDVWQRPQELAVGLARHRPVLFLSPVQVHQAAGRLAGRWSPVRLGCEGRLLVASPLRLSGEYRVEEARALNRALLERWLREAMGGMDFLFLTNSPFVDHLVQDLKPSRVGYELIDDFCAFAWAPPDGREREDRLLALCDFAFAGTSTLARRYAGRAPGLRFLPSGVAFGRLTRPVLEPPELRGLPRPRLLYVGTLNDRLDGHLIDRVAREFPDGSVILVGPRGITFQAPRFPKNVHELGLRPHTELSGFYQHCDVGLMPFADNEAARAINPIKTLEYLACGLPVISTPVPDVEEFYTPPVVVARPTEWPAALRRMLAEDAPDARAARVDFARGRSWRALVEQVEGILREQEAALGQP